VIAAVTSYPSSCLTDSFWIRTTFGSGWRSLGNEGKSSGNGSGRCCRRAGLAIYLWTKPIWVVLHVWSLRLSTSVGFCCDWKGRDASGSPVTADLYDGTSPVCSTSFTGAHDS